MATATYSQFFADVLTQLNLPVTQSNLIALGAVAHLEGLNDRYNPLNSVVQSGNSTQFNSVGVQDYKSYANGVAGTVALLQGSHWDGVVNALREGNSTASVLAAFTSAYTWDPGVSFNAASGATVLTQAIGTGTPGDVTVSDNTTNGTTTAGAKTAVPKSNGHSITDPDPLAPFQYNTLKPPLSAAQKAAMEAYFVTQGYPTTAISGLEKDGDATFISTYNALVTGGTYNYDPTGVSTSYAGPGSGILSGAAAAEQAVVTAFDWFSKKANWLRIGEVALGAVIIIGALVVLFGDAKDIGDIAKVATVA